MPREAALAGDSQPRSGSTFHRRRRWRALDEATPPGPTPAEPGLPSGAGASGGPAGAEGRGPRGGSGERSCRAPRAEARRAGSCGSSTGRRSVAWACAARRASWQGRCTSVTPDSAKRNVLDTESSHLPRVLRGSAPPAATIGTNGGTRPHRQARGLAAAVRERIPQLLLAGPPLDPGDRLRARDRRHGVARGRSGQGRLAARPAQPRRGRHLDPDRVLAAPAGLPLGARQRLRAPHALHHPRHPPRPSRTTRCGW